MFEFFCVCMVSWLLGKLREEKSFIREDLNRSYYNVGGLLSKKGLSWLLLHFRSDNEFVVKLCIQVM